MKVVQTTEFEVLGPLTPENAESIQQEMREKSTFIGTLSTFHTEGGYYALLGDDHTIRLIHPADYAANYETVENNTLDRMEEEFDLGSLAQQGELHTEEVWQFFEPYTTLQHEVVERWWDGEDEQNARIRTTNGQVRMRRDVTVNGPWKYFEVKA